MNFNFKERLMNKLKYFSLSKIGILSIIIVLLIYLYGVMISISPEHIGIVFDKWGVKPKVEGRFIVEKGEKGYWREVLEPGWHSFLLGESLWRYNIEEVPMTYIPAGKVGEIEALDGDPIPMGQILAKDDFIDNKGVFHMGQKGPRKEVLKPGLHLINTKYLKVTQYDAVTIGKNHIGIKIRKDGDIPPQGMILVSEKDNYKGIQKETLPPGTYYFNMRAVEIEKYPITIIKKGQVGIITKKVGKMPPEGTILVDAEDEYRGIQKQVLQPGRYPINPYEKGVKIVDAINIPDGHVGVQIAETGKSKPSEQLLAKPGERGILEETLSPGMYYINPYEFNVIIFDIRQQRYEMTYKEDEGDTRYSDSVNFLSNDGFTIQVDLTIIFKILPEDAPYVVATVGRDIDSVTKKKIRPTARAFARLLGSKEKGEGFIHGETREQFQIDLHEALKKKSGESKIQVMQTLVRHFEVPDKLKEPIVQKVIALKLQEKYEQEQKTQEAKAELARQEEMVILEAEKIKAETEKARKLIAAEMKKQESLIEYERKLETAKLEKDEAVVRNETATIDAERIKTLADARAYEKRKAIEADNALEPKLNAAIAIHKVWAEAFANRKVPTYVFGGDRANNVNQDAQAFQQTLNALIAKELVLDSSIKSKGTKAANQ